MQYVGQERGAPAVVRRANAARLKRLSMPLYIHAYMPTAVFHVRLRRVGNSWVITVPKEIVEGSKWKEGDDLAISSTDKLLTITGPSRL